MSFAPSSPVTGSPQTGLTSPTYTLSADYAPEANGKQYAITALGGTQTGVEAHTASNPFTCTMFRPKNVRLVGVVDPNTGMLRQVPLNNYTFIVRKGVVPLSGQNPVVATMRQQFSVPAGADLADPESIRAMLSLSFGLVWASSSAFGDTVLTAVL